MIYSLLEIQAIIQLPNGYILPTNILQTLDRIEKEINNSSIKKMYATPATNNNIDTVVRHKENRSYPSSSSSSSNYNPNTINRFKDKEKEKDLSWENIRNFKITKMEKKEGTDKMMNDIRICLNKMSNKNYDIQRNAILELLNNISTDNDDLQKIATAIFDIASTNKFYSEMYAKIYKGLMDIYPVFQTILNDFLLQFLSTVSDLKYVDPNIDYDAFCNYNKLNDKKKATAVFIIHMMKQTAILPKNVLDILHHLILKLETCMNTDNQLNEVEEMTELVNLFILEGFSFLSVSFVEKEDQDLWQTDLLKIREFSQLKMKEKKSLSSRVIFKYMDICSFMDKNK